MDDLFKTCSIFRNEKRQAKPLNKKVFFSGYHLCRRGFPYVPATKNSSTLNKKSFARRFIVADEGFQIPKIVIIPPGDHYGTRCHS
jgi:hypothetical protein